MPTLWAHTSGGRCFFILGGSAARAASSEGVYRVEDLVGFGRTRLDSPGPFRTQTAFVSDGRQPVAPFPGVVLPVSP